MNTKVILFVICLAALLAFQAKIVMPFIQDIASSDLFMEDSGDEKNRVSSDTTMTASAYDQCNFHIANKLLSEEQAVTFSDKPINAFSLGNFQYVINADLEILPADGAAFTRRYACRIKYENDDDTSGLDNEENWSIEGISGLDNI